MHIGTADEVRTLDTSVIRDFGISQTVLMENAALAAREAAFRLCNIKNRPEIKNRPILPEGGFSNAAGNADEDCVSCLDGGCGNGFGDVCGPGEVLAVCGGGNNGGDALALARLLYAKGADVTVLHTSHQSVLSGSVLENFRIIQNLKIKTIYLDKTHERSASVLLEKLDFSSFSLIIDGLFGTGLCRPVGGILASLVEKINSSGSLVLSMDIPSGVNADTGEIMGCAVDADATAVFGMLKRGNLLYPGFERSGRLFFSEISFPPETRSCTNLVINIPEPLKERDPWGHKGLFGKVLVTGGSPAYRGAPMLAASAALKSGSGYVRLAVPNQLVSQIFPLLPEAVFIPLECGGKEAGSEHAPALLEECIRSDSLVLGPGLSTAPQSISLAQELIRLAECPIVIDGDALTALAGKEELCKNREKPTILTPHAQEMARILGCSVKEVVHNRVDCAIEAADRYNAITVLKGAHSIIALPSGKAMLNLTGNAGMATAGSGDVLAGIVGALLAQAGKDGLSAAHAGRNGALAAKEGKAGLSSAHVGKAGTLTAQAVNNNMRSAQTAKAGTLSAQSEKVRTPAARNQAENACTLSPHEQAAQAACLAVYIHGLAGDIAAEAKGKTGITATDILSAVPQAFKNHAKEISKNPYSGKIIEI